MIPRLRRGAIVLCLAAALALAGGTARAVEAGPGTKNFNVPAGVPDHFSNEAEPFAASPAARGPVPRSTVSRGPRSRHVAARRGRMEHRRVVHGRVVYERVVRGHAVHKHVVASRAEHRRRATVSAARHVEHGHRASHARTAARHHAAAAKRRG